MRRAPFITFEGPDGGGKSSQVALLADYLGAAGWSVVTTREPGGTPLGDALRQVLLHRGDISIAPESEALILSAARFQHVHDVIEPALARGQAVLCDRFADSTIAYQGGGHGIDVTDLRCLQEFATGGIAPDLRILLDVPVEVGLRRRFGVAESVNRIDRAPVEFHERVRQAFLRLAHEDPDGWAIVDGVAGVASVAETVHTVVNDRVLCRYATPDGTVDIR